MDHYFINVCSWNHLKQVNDTWVILHSTFQENTWMFLARLLEEISFVPFGSILLGTSETVVNPCHLICEKSTPHAMVMIDNLYFWARNKMDIVDLAVNLLLKKFI